LPGTVRQYTGDKGQHVAIIARGRVRNVGDVFLCDGMRGGSLLGIDGRWAGLHFNFFAVLSDRLESHLDRKLLPGNNFYFLQDYWVEGVTLYDEPVRSGMESL
jgi:hypothetical protein